MEMDRFSSVLTYATITSPNDLPLPGEASCPDWVRAMIISQRYRRIRRCSSAL